MEFQAILTLAGVSLGTFKREDRAGENFVRVSFRGTAGGPAAIAWWDAPVSAVQEGALVLPSGEGEERFEVGATLRVTLSVARNGGLSIVRVAHADAAAPVRSLVG